MTDMLDMDTQTLLLVLLVVLLLINLGLSVSCLVKKNKQQKDNYCGCWRY